MEAAALQRVPPLNRYADPDVHAGISAYALLRDAIVVEFRDGSQYLYNQDCPGRRHVERMRALAQDRLGLDRYINRRVGRRFAAKLR